MFIYVQEFVCELASLDFKLLLICSDLYYAFQFSHAFSSYSLLWLLHFAFLHSVFQFIDVYFCFHMDLYNKMILLCHLVMNWYILYNKSKSLLHFAFMHTVFQFIDVYFCFHMDLYNKMILLCHLVMNWYILYNKSRSLLHFAFLHTVFQFIVAPRVISVNQKHGLLLYLGGMNLPDVYHTLGPQSSHIQREDATNYYKAAMTMLTDHFNPTQPTGNPGQKMILVCHLVMNWYILYNKSTSLD